VKGAGQARGGKTFRTMEKHLGWGGRTNWEWRAENGERKFRGGKGEKKK